VRPLLDAIEQILGLLSEGPFPDDPGTNAKRKDSRPAYNADTDTVLRLLQHVRYGLMDALGAAPADWDYYDPDAGRLTRPRTGLLPIALYLDDIRSPYNVGSIFRTAEAFGIEKIYLSRYTASPAHKRAVRTSMGCTEILPWQIADLEEAARERPIFALELGGTPIEQYSFPYRGIAVLGSEELGISPEARRIASDSGGIVSVPLRGAKGSLNVAVAAGILLHAWSLSLGSQPEAPHRTHSAEAEE
jgi:TrmH family RNA methyltransferase